MKFNRLQLIARLEGNVTAYETERDTEWDLWNGAVVSWRRHAAQQQRLALLEYADAIAVAVNNTSAGECVSKDDLPSSPVIPRPNSSSRRWDINAFEVASFEPTELLGAERPHRFKRNTESVRKLIDALKLMLDDEVSSSGIESLGYRDVLQTWL